MVAPVVSMLMPSGAFNDFFLGVLSLEPVVPLTLIEILPLLPRANTTGVMTLAILQIFFGAINVTYQLVMMGSVVWERVAGLVLDLTVVYAGAYGLCATWNLDAVSRNTLQVRRTAQMYYSLTMLVFWIYLLIETSTVIYNTVAVASLAAYDPSAALPKAGYITAIWAILLVGLMIQMYFLFVIWSYKTILEDAAAGNPRAGYVVKGLQAPRPEGNSPASTAPGKLPKV